MLIQTAMDSLDSPLSDADGLIKVKFAARAISADVSVTVGGVSAGVSVNVGNGNPPPPPFPFQMHSQPQDL